MYVSYTMIEIFKLNLQLLINVVQIQFGQQYVSQTNNICDY